MKKFLTVILGVGLLLSATNGVYLSYFQPMDAIALEEHPDVIDFGG